MPSTLNHRIACASFTCIVIEVSVIVYWQHELLRVHNLKNGKDLHRACTYQPTQRASQQAIPWAWNQWHTIRFDEHGHGCLRGISVLCQVPILNVRPKASSSSHRFTPRGALAVVQGRTRVGLQLASAPIQREVLIATCAIVVFAKLKEPVMAWISVSPKTYTYCTCIYTFIYILYAST